MKLAFIFPFIRNNTSVIEGLPLSTPSLIGNIKDIFSNVIFEQIDLKKEFEIAIMNGAINKEDYVKAIKNVDGLMDQCSISRNIKTIKGSSFTHFTGNRHGVKYYIPSDEDLEKFEEIFFEIFQYAQLEKFDHYLLTVYQLHEPDVVASLLFAQYLKKVNQNKKIIFGGLRNYENNFAKVVYSLDFVDALVVGRGENSLKEIIKSLANNKKLEKVYKCFAPSNETLGLPDYESFRSFEYFKFSSVNLEKAHHIKLGLKEKKLKKIVFVPYKFSHGCFWGQCIYCGASGAERKGIYYTKSIKDITSDLIKLKEICQTKYFIFFNNNFNSNLNFTKKLLKGFIKNKLDIIWTDSFNLVILDDEMIDLLAEAGCVRMDIGLTTFNNSLQKFYHNILQEDKYLSNLEKIYKRGIWVDINMIANLPFSYSSSVELKYLEKYSQYIDSVTLNSFRAYWSELVKNFRKYNLNDINEKAVIGGGVAPMYFMEKEFKGTLDERKRLFAQNYLDLKNFFIAKRIPINRFNFHLLGYLYSCLGFKNKKKIKDQMIKENGVFYAVNYENHIKPRNIT